MAGDVTVQVFISPSKVAAYFKDPNGDLTRDLVKRGTRVQNEARRLVGKRTHNLEHRIVKRVVQINGVPVVQVGAVGVKYALWHHEGTRPHVIRPVRAKALRFEVDGNVVFARRVNHPGTKPNRYLINALRVAR